MKPFNRLDSGSHCDTHYYLDKNKKMRYTNRNLKNNMHFNEAFYPIFSNYAGSI